MSFITINNQHIPAVTWDSGRLCDHNVTGNAHIWQIDVDQKIEYINKLIQVLEPAEITRADKYYKASDRNRFITSRGALRYILSAYLNIPAAAIRFELEENKKAHIAYPIASQLHFNVSDSADRILIAIAGSMVGIDIECINANFRYHDILENNFSKDEADYIKDNHQRFYSLWTRKEAILKATGMGLTEHLKQIPALDDEHKIDGDILSTISNWQLNSFEPTPGYTATIASKPGIGLQFWDFDPDLLNSRF